MNQKAPSLGVSHGLAVVTGASRGLGRELAVALAREGYDLMICARGGKDLESIREKVMVLGRKCEVWQGDLTAKGGDHRYHEPARAAFEEVLDIRPVDILINNAGMAQPLMGLEEITRRQGIYDLFELNLYVPIWLMQAVIPGMKALGSGTIVNICSLSGRRAIRNVSLYCASKFALRGLTESVAQELEGTGVCCFSVSPGGLNSQMRNKLFGDAAQQQDPAAVAQIIVDAISGRVLVPNGWDLVIRGGEFITVSPEEWTGIRLGPWKSVPV